MSEFKIIFTGAMGSGKTTAIAAISETEVVSTDMGNSATDEHEKATTTVAMDFGSITLDDGGIVRLYGTPGQRRFEFMWGILSKGALGLVILVDNSRERPLEDLAIYLDNFAGLIEDTGAVIGVTCTDKGPGPALDEYYEVLLQRKLILPVFPIDARKKTDVLTLLEALFSYLEAVAR